VRLCKNLLLARIAYVFRVRGLRRRNQLILIDRYFYNYELDADSVRYAGPKWLLKLLLPLFPRPDVVLTLEANAEALLSRKRELSAEQIARQIEIKGRLDFHGANLVAVNAMEPAAKVADATMAAVTDRSMWKPGATEDAGRYRKEPCQTK
jgi:thymidylate kinase